MAGVGCCWGPLEELCAYLAPFSCKARVFALVCNLLRLTWLGKCLADAGDICVTYREGREEKR